MSTAWLKFLSDGVRAAVFAERKALSSRLIAISAKRAALEIELSALRQAEEELIAVIEDMSSGQASDHEIELSRIGTGREAPLAGQTEKPEGLVAAIVGAFNAAGIALHYKQLALQLENSGIHVGGRDAAGTLLAILTNSRYADKFVRVGRGVYRLNEGGGIVDLEKPAISARRRVKRRRVVRK